MVIDEDVISVVSQLSRDRGSNMLESITLALAKVIQAEHTFIARLDSRRTLSTTEAYVNSHQIANNFSYELRDTPCALVSDNSICCYNGDVQSCFPKDQLLVDMGIHSYVGTPLFNAEGEVFGIIVALYEGQIQDTEAVTSLFTLFSGLIAGDIERREKQQALNLTEAIIHEMDEAVVLSNDQHEIISCNKAFTELTGYTSEEAVGHNPNLLKSGIQDDAFYQRFWKELNDTGSWEGEIYNRKKSGDLYPEHMRIRRIIEPESGSTFYLTIHQDLSDLNQAREEAYFNKNFDGLTQLPNRQLFLDRLSQQLHQDKRNHDRAAIMCVDLDGFQGINTTLGHEIGNQLLQILSRRFQNRFRNTDIIGHLGSDEFAFSFNALGDALDAQEMAQDLLNTIKEPFDDFSESICISGTVGIALYPDDGNKSEDLLAKADQAMVHAKSQGKDRLQFFTTSIQDSNNSLLKLKGNLQQAIANNDLAAAFQPIICSRTGRIMKLEALARWPSDNGFISPAEFIPVAEEFGFCHEIGNIILKQSCELLEKLNAQGRDLSISVNRSIAEFKELKHDVSSWLKTIKTSHIRPEQISFEITESLLAYEQDALRQALYQLKDFGSPILLDDFGTGYSSLSYLRSFPIDFLKIDRSFVMDLGSSHEARSLVSSIIAMSKALQIKTIAEGIETKQQHAILGSLECDYYQGFYFSKPLFADDLLNFIETYRPNPNFSS